MHACANGIETVGGFLNLVSAAWINWFNAILFGALLVLEIFFMPETLYPRTLMLSRMPQTTTSTTSTSSTDLEGQTEKSAHTPPVPTPSTSASTSAEAEAETESSEMPSLPRTKSLPLFNYTPIPGLSHAPLYTTLTRFVSTFTLPIIPLAVLGYSFLWYWWVLSVITMIPAAYPSYTPLIQGLLFLGLFLGTILSEVFCSGRLSDAIVRRLAKRNGGVRVAEMRLPLAFPAILLTGVGLVVWGVSLDKGWHWAVGQVGLFFCESLFFPFLFSLCPPHQHLALPYLFSCLARALYCTSTNTYAPVGAGIQIGNTVTSSYIIDSYPLQSTAVVIFYAVFLNLSAFVNPVYFTTPSLSSLPYRTHTYVHPA
jgi:hypothetical protein